MSDTHTRARAPNVNVEPSCMYVCMYTLHLLPAMVSVRWRWFYVMLWKNFMLMRSKRMTLFAVTAVPILIVYFTTMKRQVFHAWNITTVGIRQPYRPGSDICPGYGRCDQLVFFVPEVTITTTIMQRLPANISELKQVTDALHGMYGRTHPQEQPSSKTATPWKWGVKCIWFHIGTRIKLIIMEMATHTHSWCGQ